MTIPRRVVKLLLILSLLLCVAGGLMSWIAGPVSTIHQFTELLEAGKTPEAFAMIQATGEPKGSMLLDTTTGEFGMQKGDSSGERVWIGPIAFRLWCTAENLQIYPPTLSDVVRGRRRFDYDRLSHPPLYFAGHADWRGIVFHFENWAVETRASSTLNLGVHRVAGAEALRSPGRGIEDSATATQPQDLE